MARYPRLLGRSVDVLYRAGDVVLPASGTLVADSGRSIFLEQSVLQRGQTRHFRWEIPYQYIVRIEESARPEVAPKQTSTDIAHPSEGTRVAAAAAVPGFIPLTDKPKPA
jgi:hypothetical protein